MTPTSSGPKPLRTLLEVTGVSVRELCNLARSEQWDDSPERAMAVAFAGARLPMDRRRATSVNRPEAAWPWIDALDALSRCARGEASQDVADDMGYTLSALYNRTSALTRAASAADERALVMADREGRLAASAYA